MLHGQVQFQLADEIVELLFQFINFSICIFARQVQPDVILDFFCQMLQAGGADIAGNPFQCVCQPSCCS